MMVYRVCDCCGREIIPTISECYYKISIDKCRNVTHSALRCISNDMANAMNSSIERPDFCESCVAEIRMFINNRHRKMTGKDKELNV